MVEKQKSSKSGAESECRVAHDAAGFEHLSTASGSD